MEEKKQMDENIVNIGAKPLNVYLLAVSTVLQKGDVTIQARGNAISKAVDVALVAQRNFNLQQKAIEIGTDKKLIEDPRNKDKAKEQAFSTIKITIGKAPQQEKK